MAEKPKAKPIMEVRQSDLTTSATDLRPKRLLVFEDRVEMRDPGLFKTQTQEMRFDQIAQVSVKKRWVFADLVIESRGGGVIHIANLSRGDAARVRELIGGRLRGPVVTEEAREPAPDIPEQIKKLAELKEQDILTIEEFEAKKRELLDRM